ncbi:hypothetical protein BDB00DRAFT_790591 [Zychaea mexicana]|uniref:uncharacterized protein n=1 Tax=Zychaea mexicana TaxID=64656 RepID=UPI0022FDEEA4|nr:uncharacterized protein BDB00DRAFT_790591 [Zychaea mexicana]KAI9490082.1 hypothetical protein BDB00DRAFT_790591 [Zychaea mexicana]
MDDTSDNIVIKAEDINMQEQSTSCASGENTHHDTTTPTVTSSSPTPSSSALQPYHQQLHEAMLAAVNSHGVASLSQHGQLIAAVAAAVGAGAAAVSSSSTASSPSSSNNNNNTSPPPPPQQQLQPQLLQPQNQQHQPPTQQQTPRSDIDFVKRDNIRAANRERKKKWRIHNEERNKDNDLRCRVNKRASKLFGPADTEAKRAWANDEFEKRRQKRMEKERRKNMIDNVLSVPGSPSSGIMTVPSSCAGATTTSSADDAHQSPQQQAAALAAAAALPEQLGYYAAAATAPPPPMTVDQSAAAKMLDFPPELQRQLLEQLNNMIVSLLNNPHSNSSS